jgi:hypothetical protein
MRSGSSFGPRRYRSIDIDLATFSSLFSARLIKKSNQNAPRKAKNKDNFNISFEEAAYGTKKEYAHREKPVRTAAATAASTERRRRSAAIAAGPARS